MSAPIGQSLNETSRACPNLLMLTERGLLRRIESHNQVPTDLRIIPSSVVGHDLQEKEPAPSVLGPIAVETSRGYLFQGREDQPVTVVGESGQWIEKTFGQVRESDRMPLRIGGLQAQPQEIVLPPLAEAYWTSDYSTRVPRRMTAELAEFIGYFMGDGSLHSKGIRLCVAQADQDVLERLSYLGQELFGLQATVTQKSGYVELAFNSIRLVLWWEACGFAKTAPHAQHRGKGYAAHITQAVLYSDDTEIYTAFIRGLFEADGTVNNHYVSWTTTTLTFSREVQTLLLALGFVTTRKYDKPTKTSWAVNTRFVLRLLNVSSVERFVKEIGFLSRRKNTLSPLPPHAQAARFDHIPTTRAEIDRLAPRNDRLRKVLLMSTARSGTMTRRIGEELLQRTGDQRLKQKLGFYYDQVVAVQVLASGPQP
jgi:ribonucleoside-diphosphate reductase alpha chain